MLMLLIAYCPTHISAIIMHLWILSTFCDLVKYETLISWVLVVSYLLGSTDLFLYPPMCAYNFIPVLIFLLPKPWLLHTNTPMYDKLLVTAVGVLCIVRGVGRGGP